MEPPSKAIPKLIIPKLVIRSTGGNEEAATVVTAAPLGFSQLPASLHSSAGRLLLEQSGRAARLAPSPENSLLSLREMVKNLVCLHLLEFESYLDVAAHSPVLDKRRDLLRLLNAHHDHWRKLAFLTGWSDWMREAQGAQVPMLAWREREKPTAG